MTWIPKKKSSGNLILASLLLSLVICEKCPAGFDLVECSVLQYHLDRLYFGAGIESGIYRNCRFVVSRNDSSIYYGCIEAAYNGVSYSYPTERSFDSVDTDSLAVHLEPAQIDSQTILLGNAGTYDFVQKTTDTLALEDDRAIIKEYDSQFEMVLDYESGKLDGFFSFQQYRSLTDSTHTIAAQAPFYAALIPNPSRTFNEHGFITTSLYYRYDPAYISLIFDGDRVTVFNCLSDHIEQCPRVYAYNPEAGRSLLTHIRPLPKGLSIGIPHTIFDKAARYFADILSRDRIRIVMQPEESDADIYTTAVPLIHGNQLYSLRYLQQLLAKDTVDGQPINEVITIIGDYLNSAERTTDTQLTDYYCHLAETSLRDEIGVYPLFRPTVFFTFNERLTRCAFDSSGFFDLSKPVRNKVPSYSECER